MKLPGLTRRRFLGLAASSGLALAAEGLFLEPTWVRTRVVKLARGAPTHRLVHFTDIHHKGDRAYLESVVEKINALAPDFVCFTGDIIEDCAHLPEALEILSGIHAPLYGVPGNHDYWSNADFQVVDRMFSATGGRWLVNQRINLNDGKIHLIGAACDRTDIVQRLPGAFNILLFHYPAWVDSLKGASFDLLLAGHSHGGQVRLPFIGPLVLPGGVGRYDLGLYHTPCGLLNVNPGIGWMALDIRLNCRPEITVFDI
ncbi:MAG TPA: metallophosphoesterase [Opitutales bacterium]|nr:metallophosphoesterase [Opitutales bacterium]